MYKPERSLNYVIFYLYSRMKKYTYTYLMNISHLRLTKNWPLKQWTSMLYINQHLNKNLNSNLRTIILSSLSTLPLILTRLPPGWPAINKHSQETPQLLFACTNCGIKYRYGFLKNIQWDSKCNSLGLKRECSLIRTWY